MSHTVTLQAFKMNPRDNSDSMLFQVFSRFPFFEGCVFTKSETCMLTL